MKTLTLKEARRRKKLTLEQLAAATGCHHSTLSLLERGKTLPMLATAQALERELGVRLQFTREEGATA